MLIAGGALGELVYKLGDMREFQFSRLTRRVSNGLQQPNPAHSISQQEMSR
jgi:hypothetical protein